MYCFQFFVGLPAGTGLTPTGNFIIIGYTFRSIHIIEQGKTYRFLCSTVLFRKNFHPFLKTFAMKVRSVGSTVLPSRRGHTPVAPVFACRRSQIQSLVRNFCLEILQCPPAFRFGNTELAAWTRRALTRHTTDSVILVAVVSEILKGADEYLVASGAGSKLIRLITPPFIPFMQG